MKVINILILEDNLSVLIVILQTLARLIYAFAPVIVSTQEHVEKLINPSNQKYDLVLLDHNDPLSGSFHELNMAKHDPSKIIAISSVKSHNHSLLSLGVHRIVTKDYKYLPSFSVSLSQEIASILKYS